MSATLHEDTGEEVIPPLVWSIHHPGRLSVSVISELMQYHGCESSQVYHARVILTFLFSRHPSDKSVLKHQRLDDRLSERKR